MKKCRANLSAIVLTVCALLLLAGCGGKKKAEAVQAPPQYKVRLQTTKGDVIILVHRDWSPLGADHFYELTRMGFYNDTRFFRALKGFIVQWGINGDPKINKDWSEIPIKDDPPKVSNKVGTVVFAMAGPSSRTTQVFINLGDNSGSLDRRASLPSAKSSRVWRTYRTYIWNTAKARRREAVRARQPLRILALPTSKSTFRSWITSRKPKFCLSFCLAPVGHGSDRMRK